VKRIGSDGMVAWEEPRRKDAPSVLNRRGSHTWLEGDKVHRVGAPASLHPGGMQYWYERGGWVRHASPPDPRLVEGPPRPPGGAG
jgi:hypothetical protein